MLIVIKNGRNFGYKYSCKRCKTVYVATHNEESHTSAGYVYTVCPVCGAPVVWADMTKEVDCSEYVKSKEKGLTKPVFIA